jgi:hypothetical protein
MDIYIYIWKAHCHTLLRALPHTATLCRTLQHALPHTVAVHTATYCCSAAHRCNAALPDTHYRTAAHYRAAAHCRTAAHCRIPAHYSRKLPHTAVHTAIHTTKNIAERTAHKLLCALPHTATRTARTAAHIRSIDINSHINSNKELIFTIHINPYYFKSI